MAEEALEITKQPEDVTGAAGETVSVHVEANKADAAYQWQWSADEKTWKNCTSAGSNTDTFSFAMKATLSGRHYRCIVTSGNEQVISESALVSCEEPLKITEQPEDVTAAAGETVSVHVEANKADACYQWQWSADEKTWKNCTSAGSNTDTFSFAMKAQRTTLPLYRYFGERAGDIRICTRQLRRAAEDHRAAREHHRGQRCDCAVPCGGEQGRRVLPVAVERGRKDVEGLHISGEQYGYVQFHDEREPQQEALPLHRDERGRAGDILSGNLNIRRRV